MWDTNKGTQFQYRCVQNYMYSETLYLTPRTYTKIYMYTIGQIGKREVLSANRL